MRRLCNRSSNQDVECYMINRAYDESRKEMIKAKYERFAPQYDKFAWIFELLTGLWILRPKLIKMSRGQVLELAVGTGVNLPLYDGKVSVTAIDYSPEMLERAVERAHKLELNIGFKEMDAEELDFPNNSFDTVLSTLGLCTYPDPIKALREMSRVCRPEGSILLLEHGISHLKWLADFQNRKAVKWANTFDCNLNRNHYELVKESGLYIKNFNRSALGLIYWIEACPQAIREQTHVPKF